MPREVMCHDLERKPFILLAQGGVFGGNNKGKLTSINGVPVPEHLLVINHRVSYYYYYY